MAERASVKRLARPVPIFVTAPGAGDVRVTGDFSRWSKAGIRLSNHGHGEWRAMIPLEPGVYEYRLLIDGVWADHEQATKRVRNPFGSENCILTVS